MTVSCPKPLRIAYFGSPSFSATLLERIEDYKELLNVEIVLVVTQPDKPSGRGLTLQQTAVKMMAEKYSLLVYDKPLQEADSEIVATLKEKNVDLVIVYAFSEILSAKVLASTTYGFWNVHPSLLPEYRGPSPIIFPLLRGDEETGVTLMQMEEKMDQGNIIGQTRYTIKNNDTQETLIQILTDMAFDLIKIHIKSPESVDTEPQKQSVATYTRRLVRQDGYVPITEMKEMIGGALVDSIVFTLLAWFEKRNDVKIGNTTMGILTLFNMWRALTPWPGLWTSAHIDGRDVRVKVVEMKKGGTRNPIVSMVQLEGKKPVSFTEFCRAYPEVF